MTDYVVGISVVFRFVFVPRRGRQQHIPSKWTIVFGEPAGAILPARLDPDVLTYQKANGSLRKFFFLCAPAFHELWYHAASVDRLGFPKAALLIVGVRAPYHMCLIVPQVYCLVVRVI